MVDSINPSGQVQGIQSAKSSSSKDQDVKDSEKKQPAPVDDVQISKEAIDLVEAEKAAKDIASSLSSDANATLSADQERLSTLI